MPTHISEQDNYDNRIAYPTMSQPDYKKEFHDAGMAYEEAPPIPDPEKEKGDGGIYDIFLLHDRLSGDAVALMRKKNHDYGGNSDPYRNFRMAANLGVDPLAGILVRMGDKLARLGTYVEKGQLQVKDESVRDTVLDIINYAVLFYGMSKAELKAVLTQE